MGLGWKSLKALILRAPLCGANNGNPSVLNQKQYFDSYAGPNMFVCHHAALKVLGAIDLTKEGGLLGGARCGLI